MKKLKLALELTLCLGFLFSVETIQESTAANVGCGLSKLCGVGEGATVFGSAMTCRIGAYAGAKIGASIVWFGDPVGAAGAL